MPEIRNDVEHNGEDYVRWAYRLLLGREPESLEAVQQNPFKNNRQRLVQTMLNSTEFLTNYRHSMLINHPYASWEKDAVAFIHVPKTGGSTLHALLSTCFSKARICPERFGALHCYSPADLISYDLFSGHFDFFSLHFIPKQRVRCISLLREPCRRLLSWYRFSKSHPPSGEFANDISVRLANELSVEEYFEHDFIVRSAYTNNPYLFFFGSSLYDRATLDAFSNSQEPEEACNQLLARATQRILDLDAIGITERFDDSIRAIFTVLGFQVPASIKPLQVTDELHNLDVRFSHIPPITMTARLSRALKRLTKYDRIIYDVARAEFERRLSAAPNSIEVDRD